MLEACRSAWGSSSCPFATSTRAGAPRSTESTTSPRAISSRGNRRRDGQTQEDYRFGNDYDTPDGTCVRDYIPRRRSCRRAYPRSRRDGARVLRRSQSREAPSRSPCSMFDPDRRTDHEKTVRYTRSDRAAGRSAALLASSRKAESVLGWKKTRSSSKEIVVGPRVASQHPEGYPFLGPARTLRDSRQRFWPPTALRNRGHAQHPPDTAPGDPPENAGSLARRLRLPRHCHRGDTHCFPRGYPDMNTAPSTVSELAFFFSSSSAFPGGGLRSTGSTGCCSRSRRRARSSGTPRDPPRSRRTRGRDSAVATAAERARRESGPAETGFNDMARSVFKNYEQVERERSHRARRARTRCPSGGTGARSSRRSDALPRSRGAGRANSHGHFFDFFGVTSYLAIPSKSTGASDGRSSPWTVRRAAEARPRR